MTKRLMPDCPWCREPMFVREPDLEEEPYFLTDWSLMHHACLLELKQAMERLHLPSTEDGAREALRRTLPHSLDEILEEASGMMPSG